MIEEREQMSDEQKAIVDKIAEAQCMCFVINVSNAKLEPHIAMQVLLGSVVYSVERMAQDGMLLEALEEFYRGFTEFMDIARKDEMIGSHGKVRH